MFLELTLITTFYLFIKHQKQPHYDFPICMLLQLQCYNDHIYKNKNAGRPKEAHIARNLKEFKIIHRPGENMTELDKH